MTGKDGFVAAMLLLSVACGARQRAVGVVSAGTIEAVRARFATSDARCGDRYAIVVHDSTEWDLSSMNAGGVEMWLDRYELRFVRQSVRALSERTRDPDLRGYRALWEPTVPGSPYRLLWVCLPWKWMAGLPRYGVGSSCARDSLEAEQIAYSLCEANLLKEVHEFSTTIETLQRDASFTQVVQTYLAVVSRGVVRLGFEAAPERRDDGSVCVRVICRTPVLAVDDE